MEKEIEKDYWDKHNIGTRIALVTFILIFAIVAIFAMMNGISVEGTIYVKILEITSNIAFLAFAVVTLGINGIKIIMNGLAKLKK